MCVLFHSENSEPTRCFSHMTPDEHPRRHHLADGPLSSLYAPSPDLSSFDAASVMMCCSARPASSSAPSMSPYKCPYFRPDLYRFEVRLELNDGSALSVVLTCLRLTPDATAKPTASVRHFTPPLPSFSSFGAACIKLYGLLPSLVRNTCLCCLV